MYDYRGRDGTGTANSPATGSNMQSYVVRKLADGNCWMAENLQLNLSTSHSYKVGTFAGGEADWTPNQDSSLSYNYAITEAYAENIALPGDYRNIPHNNWYYTWYGATAGQGTTSVKSDSDITRSICPKGWRLPLGGKNNTGDKSFYNLIKSIYVLNSSVALNNDPLNYYLTGMYYSGLTHTSTGYYWSSSPSGSSGRAGYLTFENNNVSTNDDAPENFGLSVRCVSL